MTTTAELLGLLKRHYVKPGLTLPGGIFVPEVGWNGGNGGGCDAIWVGFTSSSGRILVGHELKVSRSDWLSELSKPGKADAWARPDSQPGRRVLLRLPLSRDVHLHTSLGAPRRHQPPARRQLALTHDHRIEQARSDAHRAATAEVNERVEKRIAQELARAASDGRIASDTRDRLRALENALGVRINWGEPGAYYAQVTIPEIEQVRQVLADTRSVKAAVRRLVGAAAGYRIEELQRAVDTMRDALAGLTEQTKEN